MFIQSLALTLIFLFCMEICEASFVLEEGIKETYLAKYRLLENPKRALLAFCKKKEGEEKKIPLFHCEVNYIWHQDQIWQDVCETSRSRWFFPPRYYDIVLQCKLGKHAIKGLRSEWRVFY